MVAHEARNARPGESRRIYGCVGFHRQQLRPVCHAHEQSIQDHKVHFDWLSITRAWCACVCAYVCVCAEFIAVIVRRPFRSRVALNSFILSVHIGNGKAVGDAKEW